MPPNLEHFSGPLLGSLLVTFGIIFGHFWDHFGPSLDIHGPCVFHVCSHVYTCDTHVTQILILGVPRDAKMGPQMGLFFDLFLKCH